MFAAFAPGVARSSPLNVYRCPRWPLVWAAAPATRTAASAAAAMAGMRRSFMGPPWEGFTLRVVPATLEGLMHATSGGRKIDSRPVRAVAWAAGRAVAEKVRSRLASVAL